MKINNYNNLSPARCMLQRLPRPLGQGSTLVAGVSVARVRPRTSKGITDLLLPQTSFGYAPKVPLRRPGSSSELTTRLFSRLRSRSLTELTRQIAPPTKNGHAPPPIESRKSSQICQSLLCLDLVSFPVLSQIKPQAPLLVVPFRQFL